MFEYGIADNHISENVAVLDNVDLVECEMVVNYEYFVVNLLLTVGGVYKDLMALLTTNFSLFFHFYVRTTTIELSLALQIKFENASLIVFTKRIIPKATGNIIPQVLLFNSLYYLTIG